MASDLFGREDWFFHARQRANLHQLCILRVLDALRVLCKRHVPREPLDTIDHCPARVERDNRDVLTRDIPAILKHLAARHDVFVNPAHLALILAGLGKAAQRHGRKHRF